MRVRQQVLTPGMQDAQKPDLGSQVFRVRRYLQHRCRAGLKQKIVEDPGIGLTEWDQLMR